MDSANHKEETARLNRSLLLEEENRKDENKSLKAETRQLPVKAVIAKEREVVADLNRTIEQQGAKLEDYERELKNAKEQYDNDMQDISEVCAIVLCSFSPPLVLTYVHSSSPKSWSPSTSRFFWTTVVKRYFAPWGTIVGMNSVTAEIFLS